MPLSTNADSMMNILNIIFCRECSEKYNLPAVNKITLLDSSAQSSEIMLNGEMVDEWQLLAAIRDMLGDSCIEIRHSIITSYAKDIPRVIMSGVKEVGKENIIIDLTCGKKDITGSLYTTASIGQIEHMIYVEVPRIKGVFPKFDRNDYETMRDRFSLIKYESLDEIENLASLNEMDFIFYKKNVDELRSGIGAQKMESYCSQLDHIIEEYFSGISDNYRNAIRELGLISEELTDSLAEYLLNEYEDIASELKTSPRKTLVTVRLFEEKYQNKNTEKEIRERLDPLFAQIPNLFELLESFRLYRNKASHYRSHIFSREEVKLLLDMMLLVFDKIINNGIAGTIWKENDTVE